MDFLQISKTTGLSTSIRAKSVVEYILFGDDSGSLTLLTNQSP
jgi:hypothetical protein